jgi:flagellin-like protein
MERRGVSPVIATVLLIAIVVILATIVFIWGRSFLSESAVKGDRAASVSCGKVQMESEVIANPTLCGTSLQLQINNKGNVPIYGARVVEEITGEDSKNTVFDGPFSNLNSGTISVGRSAQICLTGTADSASTYKVIPKLLAKQGEQTIAFTCPEENAFSANYILA